MNSGEILRYAMIFAGIYMMGVTVMSLAKRKMAEQFCLAWGFFSFLLILGGILLRPVGLSSYISNIGLLLILLIGGLTLVAVYFISRQISDLIRKNQELAMQVSLLNHENEKIRGILSELMCSQETDSGSKEE